MRIIFIVLLVFGHSCWGKTPLPPLRPAASAQEQYEKINTHLGKNKMRMLLFWTAGIFGHGRDKLPLGGILHKDFFRYLDHFLAHVPHLTTEIIMDTITHAGSLKECASLRSKYGQRFLVSPLEPKLVDIRMDILDKTLADAPSYQREKLEALVHALENGISGNPALASDVARVWFLYHPAYTINLYVDIDTFVHNAKKLLLAEILPQHPNPDNIIRKDLIKEGISNDLIATFGIRKEAYTKIRDVFIDKQLVDPERRQICQAYQDKRQALSSENPIYAYTESVKNVCSLLRNDYERLQHIGEAKFMSRDGKSGLSLPIALLNTCGPAAAQGAQTFAQELYNGEKPSYNSWATFIWTPAKPLVQNEKLHWLVSYLMDWSLFQKIGNQDFMKKLAKEITQLHTQIQEKGSDGNTRIGLECMQTAETDEHNRGAYDALKRIFENVRSFLKKVGE